MISFRHGKTKVRIITEERLPMPHNTTPLYAEGVHMLDGLSEEKMDHFLEEHPTIIPLFEIDVIRPSTHPRPRRSWRIHSPKTSQIPKPSRSHTMLVTRLNENSPSPSESKHLRSSHSTSAPTNDPPSFGYLQTSRMYSHGATLT